MEIYKLDGIEWRAVAALCSKRIPEGCWRIEGVLHRRLYVTEKYESIANKIIERVERSSSKADQPQGDDIGWEMQEPLPD